MDKSCLLEKPVFIDHRIFMFERLYEEFKKEIQSMLIYLMKEHVEITITLSDGTSFQGISWVTTPLEISKRISRKLSENIVVAQVNGILWDLERPFEESSSLKLLDFNTFEGKQVFWHSSAHVLGEAAERYYGCHLCIGPPIEDGFFYEMAISNRTVLKQDYFDLEKLIKFIISEKQVFQRLLVTKDDLLEMFKHNNYKKTIISLKVPDGGSSTVYRCGTLVDFCMGPHVLHTGKIKAFSILKNSSSYFLGDSTNDSLQRIYGISFPESKQMLEYKNFLIEAEKRDHRKIGKEQELFFFHELSPGSCFFLPHGTRIYNRLLEFIKFEYKKRGFSEIVTPNVYNSKLWQISGHWQNYSENMFAFDVEKEQYALKPMNCPGHCLMFAMRDRSYRELPLRYADFGVLHRNEFSGALTGLMRVRRFQQDDAHIFCTFDQIKEEIANCFEFLKYIYEVFGFSFKLNLSTRPEKFIGDIETWDQAEKSLETALNNFGMPWEINPGDGAFYGPKVDIKIFDALRRQHQCATIQLDFFLPERFNLEYRLASDKENQTVYARPVIIHRAVLGSIERMLAILTEHYAGKWPFWLSPRQVIIIPISKSFKDYSKCVYDKIYDNGFYVDIDLSDNTLNKMIRNAQVSQYNFIFVIGQEEQDSNTVMVRNRDDKSKQIRISLDDVISKLKDLQFYKKKENSLE
ncbi:threonine-tRNA ligase [Pneumocystis jirovecii RU7]|uniref:Threonine--tRNA ligase, cytoplasmic n=1 Tax=Pneumocystis jirovecii (strain RU7) TaxID=1408657 RepID=A0A0W4ZHW3_PNEJ7|nr:threonine-tRNA ligase [Pneumocystis jirovecii RU7]KTW27960.1 threonine-tRNA ligase [Pneumocystis jirovecii RU7]